MSNLVRVATCNLNQWAMDFRGNLERIEESIREAKAAGCTFRTGPELEITGYGCEDSFLELDTFEHAWESVRALLLFFASRKRAREVVVMNLSQSRHRKNHCYASMTNEGVVNSLSLLMQKKRCL